MLFDSNRLVGEWDIILREELIGRIDFDTGKVFNETTGNVDELSRAPLRILKKLISNSNIVVNQDNLYSSYSDGMPESIENTITTHICRLRKFNGGVFRNCIYTKKGDGYVFKATVKKDETKQEVSEECEEPSSINSMANAKQIGEELRITPEEEFLALVDPDKGYLSFSRALLSKLYNGFITTIYGEEYPGYSIPVKKPIFASYDFQELDDIIFDKVNSDISHEVDTNKYEFQCFNTLYESEYREIVRRKVQRGDALGFMALRINIDDDNPMVTARLGTYWQNIFSSHALDYELSRIYKSFINEGLDERSFEDETIWNSLVLDKLPLRGSFHNDIDLQNGGYDKNSLKQSLLFPGKNPNTYSLLATQMLILVWDQNNRTYRLYLGRRSIDTAMLAKMYEIPPAGGFEILQNGGNEYTKDLILENASPTANVFREMLEELFRKKDLKGGATGNINSLVWTDPVVKTLRDGLKKGSNRFAYLGIACDLRQLRYTFNFVLIVKDETSIDCFERIILDEDEFYRGRFVPDLTLSNIELLKGNKYIWEEKLKKIHAPSIVLWKQFRDSSLYDELISVC